MLHELADHERLAALLTSPTSEEPVVSLYITNDGNSAEHRLILKNLVKQGEELIKKDTGFDDERRKRAHSELERARDAADEALDRGKARGTFACFSQKGRLDTFRVPVLLKDRVVVDRTPYTSPLAAVFEQYERYGVVLVDHQRGRVYEAFLGTLEELEAVQDAATKRISRAGFGGLEETRKNHHAEYTIHRHLQHVADRLFAHHQKRAFGKLILGGLPETLAKLERCFHAYLRGKVVAREHWPQDIAKDDLRRKVGEIETRLEGEKERKLLSTVRDHLGGDLLATTGFDETLRALYYGKVSTLVLESGASRRGRECPECRFLFPRDQDGKETSPTLVPCPLCNRATRAVPDIMDEAVELAILSGAKVSHIAHAKEELAGLGGIASILRFR